LLAAMAAIIKSMRRGFGLRPYLMTNAVNSPYLSAAFPSNGKGVTHALSLAYTRERRAASDGFLAIAIP